MAFDIKSIKEEHKAYKERMAKLKADRKAYENYKKVQQLKKSLSEQKVAYNKLLSKYNEATPEEKSELFQQLNEARAAYEKDMEAYTSGKTIMDKDASERGNDMDKWAADYEKNNPSLTETDQFAHTASNAAVNAMTNLTSSDNAPDKSDVHLDNQAAMHEQQAAKEGMNEQQERQIANRDYRGERDKDAAAQAYTKNDIKVHELGAGAGVATAALARTTGDLDYNTYIQRQDAARQRAVANQREAEGARQTAERERAGADTARNEAMQQRMYNNEVDSLSSAAGVGTQSETETTSATTAPATNTTTEEPSNLATPDMKANMQKLLNYITYANDSTSANAAGYRDEYNNSKELQGLAAQYGVQPLDETELDEIGENNPTALQQYVWQKYPDFAEAYNNATGRGVGTDQQKNVGDNGYTQEQLNKSATVSLNPNVVNTLMH